MNSKTSKIVFTCLTGLSLCMPAAVNAGADSGAFIGLGYGEATITADGSVPEGDYDFDASDTAYKIFGGYNFGVIPFLDLAVEASYVDFGNPSSTFASGVPINFDMTGFDAFGLVGLSFGPFGIFAKAGMINWDLDSTIGSTSNSYSGTDPAYGLGARLAFGSFAVRAEYEYFDVSDVKAVTLMTLGAVYTF